MRAVRAPDGIELHFGHSDTTLVVLARALTLVWYRDDGTLPDGSRRCSWQNAHAGSGNALLVLDGVIEDPAGGFWAVTTTVTEVQDEWHVSTKFIRRGGARSASVQMAASLMTPVESFAMVPGALYNGNRADIVFPRPYCPLPTWEELRERPDFSVARVIADIPRQDSSADWTAHLWGHQAASAEVSTFDPAAGVGVHFGHGRTDGPRVLGIRYRADLSTGRHEVAIENPCVRQRRYRGCYWTASGDKPWRFEDGATATIDLSIATVRCKDVPDFVTSWTRQRDLRRLGKAAGQNHPPARPPNIVPRSHAAKLAVEFRNKYQWNEQGFYSSVPASSQHVRRLILGWGGGTSELYAIYKLGSLEMQERVRSTAELILREAQAPGGLFFGARLSNGKWLGADGTHDSFWDMNILTPRRTTDTIAAGYHLSDAIRVGGHGDLANRLDAAWNRACAALARVWHSEGEIPFLLDPLTEKAVWRGGHAGARAIGALTIGASRYLSPGYLTVAAQIADRYVAQGLARGETWGGPSDTLQGTTDQESLTALTEGLVLLHQASKEEKYLRWAMQAADLLSTWVMTEHVEFPKESVLGSHDIHSFGALIASTQNCWGTPGFCVNSGRFLIDLYEATGESRFMDLLSDVVRVPMQMAVLPGEKWGDLQPGEMTECASFGDVPDEFGHAYLNAASWPVNAMMLSQIELPSLYVDGNKIWQLDHIEGASRQPGGLIVTNPTKHLAEVRVKWRDGRSASFSLAANSEKLVS